MLGSRGDYSSLTLSAKCRTTFAMVLLSDVQIADQIK